MLKLPFRHLCENKWSQLRPSPTFILDRQSLFPLKRADDIVLFIGGRTAWSCNVTVDGTIFPARYWFDGPYVDNAKEDAAEVALKVLDPAACQPPSQGAPKGTVP